MCSKINTATSAILCQFSSKKPFLGTKTKSFFTTLCSQNKQEAFSIPSSKKPKPKTYTVKFKTLGDGKLGISRYPDFDYNAEGGTGDGVGTEVEGDEFNDVVSVDFDLKTLSIPPLTTATTRFLGLPLPPFLKIDIVPQLFRGKIDKTSGKVDLEFKAKFLFSAGSIYRAPPLMVETVLTSDESAGEMRRGTGERLDKEGKCRLVGVATVDPIDDFLMNSFLALPTECLANLNAIISVNESTGKLNTSKEIINRNR